MEEWKIPPGLVRRELVLLKIINTGKVPFVIQSIHFEFTPKTGTANMLLPDPSYGLTSMPLPARLEFSEEFTFQIAKTALEQILEKSSEFTSLSIYTLTTLEDRIELKSGPQLDEFIQNWKRKRKETMKKGEESA